MDSVTRIRPSSNDSPWRLLTIERAPDADCFVVYAFDGYPSLPETRTLYMGTRPTVREAAILAHAKAAQHGIHEVVDLTDDQGPEGAAA